MNTDQLQAENQWLREELRQANRLLLHLKTENPLAERLGKVTLTLMEAINILREVHGNETVDRFLKKVDR